MNFPSALCSALLHLEKSRFRLIFPEKRQFSPVDIQRMVEKSPHRLEFRIGPRLTVDIHLPGRDEVERLEAARNSLEKLV